MTPERVPSDRRDALIAAALPRCPECNLPLVAYYRTVPDGRTTAGLRCLSCHVIRREAPDPQGRPSMPTDRLVDGDRQPDESR